MRSWTIIFEAGIAILILLGYYLMYMNIRELDMLPSYNVEYLRKSFLGCNPLKNYKFILDYLNGTTIYCEYGNKVEKISFYKIEFVYLYSGYEYYTPFILILGK